MAANARLDDAQTELARDPAHPLAWQFLGDALAKSGNPAEAIDALQRATWLNGCVRSGASIFG